MPSLSVLIVCGAALTGIASGSLFAPFDSKPFLTLTVDPTTSVCINWNTIVQGPSIVAYGESSVPDDTLILFEPVLHHHVVVNGLTPGTHYCYQVLPDGDLKTFTTFPLSSDDSDSFAFLVIGDTRTGHLEHQKVVDCMYELDRSFYIHTGDLVDDGRSVTDWETYFQIEDTLAQKTAITPAIGNHEYPYWPFDTLFALPGEEEYYSFDYGNSHVIILNTNADIYGDQIIWLESDLQAASVNPVIDWIFAAFHHPPYSSGYHGSSLRVRDAWCSLFEWYDVDIVFSGHEHSYERTWPINGVVYIVTGGGGAPLCGVGSSPWTAFSDSIYHFCRITIQDRTLFLQAIATDGLVFDSMIIQKPSAGGVHTSSPLVHKPDLAAYPCPFSHTLTVTMELEHAGDTGLSVFDLTGRKVVQLYQGFLQEGNHQVVWDCLDSKGIPVSPGIYTLVLQNGNSISWAHAVRTTN